MALRYYRESHNHIGNERDAVVLVLTGLIPRTEYSNLDSPNESVVPGLFLWQGIVIDKYRDLFLGRLDKALSFRPPDLWSKVRHPTL